VEQQEADATALTGPQNTKNDVEVDVAKKTQVEKAAKTTPSTNTEALKIENTNKFQKAKSLRSAATINFSKNVDAKTDTKAQVEKVAETTLYA
jgi:hypothetical protein